MTHIEFAMALIRMSRHKIGVAEACTLFVLNEETTSEKVAKALKVSKEIAKGRIGILKGKRLAEPIWNPDGSVTYRLTARGRAIVASTLKTGTP